MKDLPTKENARATSFPGLRHLFPDLLQQGLLRVSTIDAAQGKEADVVILLTTRANPWHQWGHMDDANRMNVGLTRCKANAIVLMNTRMAGTCSNSAINHRARARATKEERAD